MVEHRDVLITSYTTRRDVIHAPLSLMGVTYILVPQFGQFAGLGLTVG